MWALINISGNTKKSKIEDIATSQTGTKDRTNNNLEKANILNQFFKNVDITVKIQKNVSTKKNPGHGKTGKINFHQS